MDDTSPSHDVFCIPHEGQYIIYLPLRGIILLGNEGFVNLLYKARLGDEAALSQLDTSENFITELFESKKQLEHLTRPKKLPPFIPASVSLFLTSDCTLRCKYCYAEGGSRPVQMSWDMVTGVLEQILGNVLSSKFPHMTVHFHGGGDVSASWPLLVRAREYLQDLVDPHSINVRTSVGLNGVLNPSQREWVIQNIDSATVSIDGPPDVQDFQRPRPNGGPSFPLVSETLKAFDAANFQYGIRSTVTSESVSRLDEIVSYFCEHFSAKRMKVEPMFPRGRAISSQLRFPDAHDFIKHFRRARKIALEAGRELIYSGARLEVVTNVFCKAAGDSCAITPDGWVTSCYEVINPNDALAQKFFYGHYDPQLRRLVVDNKRRQQLFNLTVLNKSFCAKCFCKWHCAGDCPVKSAYASGSPPPDVPDRCYINRELTKDQLIEAIHTNQK